MRILLALLLSLSPVLPVRAAEAPLAELVKITGLVRVVNAGGAVEAAATSGQSLFQGDRIITGAGKAEVRFANGHTLRLAPKSTIEIMAPQHPKKPGIRGTFTRLVKGSVRAIVKGLEKDKVFEIHGNSAIASVKGTDMVDDDGTVTVMDEGDSETHAVDVTDENGENGMTINEGQTGGFDEQGNQDAPDPTDPALVEQYNKEFNVDVPPPAETGGGEQGGGEQQGGGQAQGQQGSGEGQAAEGEGEEEDSDLQGEIDDQMGADDLADFSDALERQTERELGIALYDRYGNIVRRQEIITHASGSDTIEYVHLNDRGTPERADLTALHTKLTFNAALPDNSFEDIRRGLKAAFADTGPFPSYWTIEESRTLENQAGDRLREEIRLGSPTMLYDLIANTNFSSGQWYYQPDYGNGAVYLRWAQQTVYARFERPAGALVETPKEHFYLSEYGDVNAGWYAGIAPASEYPAGGVDYYGTSNAGNPTLWASSGATFTSAGFAQPIAGAPAAYVTDRDFNLPHPTDIYMRDNRGAAEFNNPYAGSGVREAFFDSATGLGYEHTTYGDGTTAFLSRYELTVFSDAQIAAGDIEAVPDTSNFDFDYDSSAFDGRALNILLTPQQAADTAIHSHESNGLTGPVAPLYPPL